MNDKSLELIQTLESPDWQERYRAVQELAIIGEPEAIEELVSLSEDDENEMVQEAAEEALQIIPFVGKDEMYSVKNGFYNPLVSSGILPEWRVDVINANKAPMTWMFTDEAAEYSGAQFPSNFLRAVLQSYQSLGDQSRDLDVIVLIGDDIKTSVGAGCCGFGLLGLPTEGEGQNISLNLANALTERLANVPGYIEVKPFWLGKEELSPYFHLQNGEVIRYDLDDSYAPTAKQQDLPDWFGTDYEFTFAKSILDTAWVYRSQMNALKQSGHFKHITQLEEY